MNHKVTPLENGDFKVESLSEFDQELKKLRKGVEFPNLKGKVVKLNSNNHITKRIINETKSF